MDSTHFSTFERRLSDGTSPRNRRLNDARAQTNKPQAQSKRLRSRISNGGRMFLGDGRSALGRRWKDLFADLSATLGRTPTIAEELLLRRAASLAVEAELMDFDLVQGKRSSTDDQTRIVNSLARTLSALGLANWTENEHTLSDPVAALRNRIAS